MMSMELRFAALWAAGAPLLTYNAFRGYFCGYVAPRTVNKTKKATILCINY